MPSSATRLQLVGFVLCAVGVCAAGCQRKAAKPPDMPPPVVTVARPATFPVQSFYAYNGHLEAVETVEIKARVKGLLQEVHFKEGDEVEAGARLYTIDPREYRTAVARSTADLAKAAADIDNWKAQIRLADAELGRLTRSPPGAVTPSEIDKARATVDINTAQLAVAQASKDAAAAALQTANIQLGYTDVKSPISGRISRTLVTKGNLVGQDMPTLLTTIVSVDPLYVYFDAPERDLLEYQRALRAGGLAAAEETGAPVEVGVTSEEGYPHKGRIDFRENRVDQSTGTVRIRGRIPNPANGKVNARLLYPGLYARVRVPSGGPKARQVIPEEALMTGQEGRFVYVLGANEIVEKRAVTLGTRVWQAPNGPTDASAWALARVAPPKGTDAPPGPVRQPLRSMVAIDQGLEPGDRIIVGGIQKARPGGPVTPDLWEIRPPREPEAK